MTNIENILDRKPDKHPRSKLLARFARAVVMTFDGKPLAGHARYRPELRQRAARLVVTTVEGGPRSAPHELAPGAENEFVEDFRSAFKEPQY